MDRTHDERRGSTQRYIEQINDKSAFGNCRKFSPQFVGCLRYTVRCVIKGSLADLLEHS